MSHCELICLLPVKNVNFVEKKNEETETNSVFCCVKEINAQTTDFKKDGTFIAT